jgi:serine protease Do
MKNKRVKVISLIAVQLLMFCCFQSAIAAPAGSSDIDLLNRTGEGIAQIAKNASPAVVSVSFERETMTQGGDQDEFEQMLKKFFGENDQFGEHFEFPGPGPKQKQLIEGLGSGFIVGSDGYILTNSHVVANADKVTVKLTSGDEYKAKVIGTDKLSDLAVVKIEAEGLPMLELGDSDQLKVGEWVIAIGNPFGLTSTVTVGVVSAKGRSGMGIETYEDFIQTDAAINMGNSGGPLLNARGKVIGINTAIVSASGGSVGIGFAIPSNMAKLVYEQLKKTGHVTRGYLGIVIQQITPKLSKYFNLSGTNGILIAEVTKDSPAEKAGLERGDVITKINDKPAKDISSFRNYVAAQQPGSEAELTIIRNGKEKTITVTIGTLPSTAAKEILPSEPGKRIGLTVQNLTDQLASQLGYKGDKGVVITQVDPGSPAYEAGLQSGMLIMQVNQKPVENVDEFETELKKASTKGSALLLVKSKNYTEYVVIELK